MLNIFYPYMSTCITHSTSRILPTKRVPVPPIYKTHHKYICNAILSKSQCVTTLVPSLLVPSATIQLSSPWSHILQNQICVSFGDESTLIPALVEGTMDYVIVNKFRMQENVILTKCTPVALKTAANHIRYKECSVHSLTIVYPTNTHTLPSTDWFEFQNSPGNTSLLIIWKSDKWNRCQSNTALILSCPPVTAPKCKSKKLKLANRSRMASMLTIDSPITEENIADELRSKISESPQNLKKIRQTSALRFSRLSTSRLILQNLLMPMQSRCSQIFLKVIQNYFLSSTNCQRKTAPSSAKKPHMSPTLNSFSETSINVNPVWLRHQSSQELEFTSHFDAPYTISSFSMNPSRASTIVISSSPNQPNPYRHLQRTWNSILPWWHWSQQQHFLHDPVKTCRKNSTSNNFTYRPR